MAQSSVHRIKGSVFVVTRDHIEEVHGRQKVEEIALRTSESTAKAFLEAFNSEWYREELHAELLDVVFDTITGRDETRLQEFIRRNTHLGLGRFARTVLSLPSPTAVLRHVPRLTGFARKGGIRAAVERGDHETLLSWWDFPFFDQPAYPPTFVGTVQALVEPTTDLPVRVRIATVEPTRLTLGVRIGRTKSTLPPPRSSESDPE